MKKSILLCSLLFALVFQGCAVKTSNSDESMAADSGSVTPATENPTDESTPVPTQGTQESDLVLPILENDTGKVLIQTVSTNHAYLYNSYILTSINGESVVVDPTIMPDPSIIEINPAAIVSTHSHSDHIDAPWTAGYEVPKLKYEKGEIQTKDFHIYSVLSSHNGDKISESGNIIAVFEVDGLRIAHMGDIGQTTLTEEQLAELGEIDIAFMQFENSYSSMSLENEKGFNLIEQLNPKIIIPTHYTNNTLPVLEEKYGEITKVENILEISKEDLPEDTLNVYMISNRHKYR